MNLFNRNTLPGDLWGGLAAMLVALPAAIAFGVSIFAPLGGSLTAQGAVAGIIGTIVLGLTAPLLGGSTRLITAPCAPAAAVLSALAITYSQQNIPPAGVVLMLSIVALLAGLIQIGFGLSGIGKLIKFIPFPVVSGYLTGVGLIIIGSQIPKVLGAPRGSHLIEALRNPSEWMWQAIAVGAAVMATMLLVPYLTRKVPAAILATLAGVATYIGLAQGNPALTQVVHNPLLIGKLDQGHTDFLLALQQQVQALSQLQLGTVVDLLIPALTLATLLSIDTLKTCVVVDAMTKSHHDSNRELIGQGVGNLSTALAGGVPGAGTMGASMINIASGGSTRLSGLLCGVFALAALLALAPLIAWIPVAALAAILIVIGLRMIDVHSLSFFFSASTRLDFMVILAVVLVAIFGNLIAASGVGVALAILLFIREQSHSTVVRNRIEGREVFLKHAYKFQDIQQLLEHANDSVIFELQGSLFFGTASQLQTELETEIGRRKYVILSMRRVQSLDVTATHILEQVKDQLEEQDAYLVFCDIPKGLPSGLRMKRFLKETGIVRPTNKAYAFRELDDALEWVMTQGAPDAAAESLAPLAVRDMPVFASQSQEALQALEQAVTLHSFGAGTFLFRAGSEDDALHIVRSGVVRVSVPIHKKDNYLLVTCGPGEFVGDIGFVEANGHVTDSLAMTDVETYVLSRRQFAKLAQQHPQLALAVIENVALGLCSKLRITTGEVQALRG